MGNAAKKPEFQTVTFKVRSKKRLTLVDDPTLLNLMKVVGKAIQQPGQITPEPGETLIGVFLLPTNNVVEILVTATGQEKGHVFANLDVWMNHKTGADLG